MPIRLFAGVMAYFFASLFVLSAQTKVGSAGTQLYSDDDLSFHYARPSGMQDESESTRERMRAAAAERRSGRSLTLILALTNGQDESSPSWASLTIQTFPRSAVRDADDLIAERKMNAWVADLRLTTDVRQVVLSGQQFAVSAFGAQQGNLRRGVLVWTTVRKGKLLSFAFAANSPEQLEKLTESMKTLEFY